MTFSFLLAMVSTGSGRGLIVFFELKIWRQGTKTESKAELGPLAFQAGIHDNRATREISRNLIMQILVK